MMKLITRFKRLTFWNKLYALGALASIIALIFFLLKGDKAPTLKVTGNIIDSNIIQIVGDVNVVKEIIDSSVKDKIYSKIREELLQELKLKETLKYYPSGYTRDGFITGPTEISYNLKKVFSFMYNSFGKTIKGKQFKENDAILKNIIRDEPYLAYAWHYLGLTYAFLSVNDEYRKKAEELSLLYFKKADSLFDALIARNPNDQYLILYKGMNLTYLSRGKKSVEYLEKALSIDEEIFSKHQLLGIITFWKHIDYSYLNLWEEAFKKYWSKNKQ